MLSLYKCHRPLISSVGKTAIGTFIVVRRSAGTLTSSQATTNLYHPGQYFLHNKLGYRGVITSSMFAHCNYQQTAASVRGIRGRGRGGTIRSDQLPLYQAIVDLTDIDDERMRLATVGWDFSTGQILKGMDYVSHSDILPYNPEAPRDFFSAPYSESKGRLAMFDAFFTFQPTNNKSVHTDLGFAWDQLLKRGFEDPTRYVLACDTPAIEISLLPIRMQVASTPLKNVVAARKGNQPPDADFDFESINLANTPMENFGSSSVSVLMPNVAEPPSGSDSNALEEDEDEALYGWCLQSRLRLLDEVDHIVTSFEWETTDDNGQVSRGTVGESRPPMSFRTMVQGGLPVPLLNEIKPVLQRTFVIGLRTAGGRLNGTFKLERDDGFTTLLTIPEVILN